MNKLFIIFALSLFIVLFSDNQIKAIPVSPKTEIYFFENTYNPESGSSIQGPVIPPFYLISKEDAGVQTILEFGRNQFIFIQPNRLVPNNFFFKNDISLTSILINYKMPVPLYIHGHALRH